MLTEESTVLPSSRNFSDEHDENATMPASVIANKWSMVRNGCNLPSVLFRFHVVFALLPSYKLEVLFAQLETVCKVFVAHNLV